jgi:hypothetical protein
MTYDFMQHRGQWVIGELSYAFLLNAVYTETLFKREGPSYRRVDPIGIGVMHLQAMENVRSTSGIIASNNHSGVTRVTDRVIPGS